MHTIKHTHIPNCHAYSCHPAGHSLLGLLEYIVCIYAQDMYMHICICMWKRYVFLHVHSANDDFQ